MRFFKYNSNENIGRVWSLFSHMAEAQINQTDFGMACDYSHTLEIVNAAMSGSISLDYESIENFNLEGYEYACSKNDRIRKLQRRNKFEEVSFISGWMLYPDGKIILATPYGGK